MDRNKILAIVFSVLSFGSLQETFRIFSSTDLDIGKTRSELIPLAVIMSGIFIFFAIRFWLKSGDKK